MQAHVYLNYKKPEDITCLPYIESYIGDTKVMVSSTLVQRFILPFSLASIALTVASIPAQAASLTTSPTTGGALPSNSFSTIGGIVLDLIGNNDVRVVSQLSGSSLFRGGTSRSVPNTLIGTQSGFTPSILNALGGGLKEVGIRFSLLDGDNASPSDQSTISSGGSSPFMYGKFAVGNFDYNKNFLLVNGINFGNWSDVTTLSTDSLGNSSVGGVSSGGFRNNTLDTGWFYNHNTSLLTSFYQSLVTTGQAKYEFNDLTPGDQYLDFKDGIDTSQLVIGLNPVVVTPSKPPEVPEPANILSTIFGIFGLGYVALMREKQKQKQQTFK